MIEAEQESIRNELPLSWSRENLDKARFSFQRLHLSRRDWISLAEIPHGHSLEEILKSLHNHSKNGFVLRGCPAELAPQLRRRGFEIVQVGLEAEMDLSNSPFRERKLRQQMQRGFRAASAEEVILSPENLKALNELQRNSTHGSKPQLRFLFRQSVSRERLFVLRDKNTARWLAALTISTASSNKAHAELLLRRKNAPPGAMEALVYAIYTRLRKEGLQYWSFGEVPFLGLSKSTGFKSLLLRGCGKTTAFAYNSPGLFSFKNKFRPNWKPVYLCGHPRLSFLACMEMAWHSGFFRLLLHSSVEIFLKKWSLSRRDI